MSIRKMSGLFLIVMGLVQIFQALSQHALPGRLGNSLYAFVTALLFSLGAALIWWDGKWWNKDSQTPN
jgi:uncharacterized membrane protein YfbV (UPF0208 family)